MSCEGPKNFVYSESSIPERPRVYNLVRMYTNSSTPVVWVWCKVQEEYNLNRTQAAGVLELAYTRIELYTPARSYIWVLLYDTYVLFMGYK